MKKVPVSDIAIPVLGGTPKRGISSYWNGSIKWATAKDVVNNKGRYLFSTAETITEEGLNNSAAKILPKGTVIITARGTVGAIAQLGENMAFNQTCYGLIPKDINKIDQDYLYYALKASIQEMRAVSYGTVFDTITMKSFDEIQIPLPLLPEQKAIAYILGTLDDKIELNRRMNETLEEMAKAIFKSWFVDFDPVIDNALKAGNPIPNALAKKAARRRAISTPKLSPEIARLFPDSFEDSPLGPIPKGWRVDTMDNHFRIIMGQSPPGNTYNEDGKGLPFYQGRIDFGFRFPSRRMYCTAPTRIANKGDTLVTVRAPVGAINMALERCCIGRGVAAIRHITGYRSYTYYFVHSLRPFFEHFEAEGTVFGSITKKDFSLIKYVMPPIELIERFEAICKPIDEMIERNECEIRTLATLRDTLLPKLISGQIRIKDAEKFLEERGV